MPEEFLNGAQGVMLGADGIADLLEQFFALWRGGSLRSILHIDLYVFGFYNYFSLF